MRNFIAFDLGASNGRAILGQFDGEKITMHELHRFENNYIEMNGVFYWDTPYLFNQLKQGLLKFKQGGYGQLDAFGIDTWGVDYGLLDKNGHLNGIPRSYRLGTQEDIDAVKEKIPAEVLYSRTGIDTSLTFNTLYQLYRRVREEDSALLTADTLLLTPDLLGYFLTGTKGTEYTIATTTQLYNPTTQDWDWETIETLGIPKHIFTKIDKTGTGSFAFCSSGTWSLFGAEMDKPDLSIEAAKAGFSNEGTIQGAYRPLRTIIGMWIIQECRRDWIKNGIDISWDGVVEEARNAEPLRSIIDPDSPEFYAGGNMEKKIQEFCRRTGQPVPETIGQVARCVYESLALKYRHALEGLEKMKGQRIDSLNIVGGPINNRFLDQLIADSLDRTVVTGPVEGAAIGNLLTQAMALGDIRDLEHLRQVVRNSESVETWTPNHTAAWEEAYRKLLSFLK